VSGRFVTFTFLATPTAMTPTVITIPIATPAIATVVIVGQKNRRLLARHPIASTLPPLGAIEFFGITRNKYGSHVGYEHFAYDRPAV
jgi:hypothetical protein